MKICYCGKEVADITTNRSLTIEEALYAIGYEMEEAEKAYNDDFPGAYLDDDGNYNFDTDNFEIVD